MKIEKQTVLDLLRDQGDDGRLQQAESELPDQLDTDEHGDLLRKYGVDRQHIPGVDDHDEGFGKLP